MESFFVDIFLSQLTYLSFKDVVATCQSNKLHYSYCISHKYSNNWRKIIEDTFLNNENNQRF